MSPAPPVSGVAGANPPCRKHRTRRYRYPARPARYHRRPARPARCHRRPARCHWQPARPARCRWRPARPARYHRRPARPARCHRRPARPARFRRFRTHRRGAASPGDRVRCHRTARVAASCVSCATGRAVGRDARRRGTDPGVVGEGRLLAEIGAGIQLVSGAADGDLEVVVAIGLRRRVLNERLAIVARRVRIGVLDDGVSARSSRTGRSHPRQPE